ncbi:MAG: hypothetical protein KGJ97_08455 [Xanthomonadaceae bacterium]|jgi:hypothetical protein|nr:hypothetical protein [Xanthomonadaceae bacterium]MDE3073178.1 hypothetical protein [Pseudomonadota bacterium]
MKLLHDFVRLRAAGRRLFSGRRDVRPLGYAVTVPPPLAVPDSGPAVGGVPTVASATAEAMPAPPPRHLCLVSSH